MSVLRVAMCQINTKVGDLDHNVTRVLEALRVAEEGGAQLALFPEMVVCGYPAEDLLIRPGFLEDNVEALHQIAAATGDCAVVIGYADDGTAHDLQGRVRSANAVAVCAGGTVVGTYAKQRFPNYGVFDEMRYFDLGPGAQPLFRVGGVVVGVSICEDIWYADGPPVVQAQGGAELLVNVNGSPFHEDKLRQREALLADRVAVTGRPVVYVNLVGGQDEIVFDGGSMMMDHLGNLRARCPQFAEDVMLVDVEVPSTDTPLTLPVVDVPTRDHPGDTLGPPPVAAHLDPDEQVWRALTLGVADYLRKNNCRDVVLGMSGGVDSSLVASVAVDALGAEHVHGVSMPSRYSSQHSRDDARDLADRLGMDLRTIVIEDSFVALLDALAPSFEGREPGLAEENLQARIRGILLMGLSNKFGWLTLATGNKSEQAVGYCTLYGDTNGAISVLKDIYKTRVYDLVRWRNTQADGPLFNDSIINKPPSAELRPGQRDDQSLPPYEVLDPVLFGYVDQDRTIEDLIGEGHDPDLVRRVARLVDGNEFKRRQVPFGIKVSAKAFGRDRRMPITNGYAEFRADHSAARDADGAA